MYFDQQDKVILLLLLIIIIIITANTTARQSVPLITIKLSNVSITHFSRIKFNTRLRPLRSPKYKNAVKLWNFFYLATLSLFLCGFLVLCVFLLFNGG